jgi:Domain of unknown function (DUF4410)
MVMPGSEVTQLIKSLALWGALALIVAIAGCATTKVEPIGVYSGQEALPKPDRILVYDFAVSPDEVSLNSGPLARLRQHMSDKDQTEAELEVGREVAAALSEELVEQIRALGLPAERASDAPSHMDRDLTIEGQFVSIDEGNRLRRMFVGFGLGNTEVKTLVQVYRWTNGGRALVQEFETSAAGSKLPGMGPMMGVGAAARGAVGLATAAGVSGAARTAGEFRHAVEAEARRTAEVLTKHLAQFFAAQGWIAADAAR